MKVRNIYKKMLNNRKRNNISLAIVAFLIIIITLGLFAFTNDTDNKEPISKPTAAEKVVKDPEIIEKVIEPKPKVEEEPETVPEPAVSQWPVTYSLSDSASLTIVVNKKHRLPSAYTPSLQNVAGGSLRPEAANALSTLLDDAATAGNSMIIVSSYRSYNTQVSTYQFWVDTQGKAEADRSSARPGHSEHQTGLAVDLGNPDGSCRLLACFGTGSAGIWLANNAHKYGFIIRYPSGKEAQTGYIYEPWHARFVGITEATAIRNSSQTMDQYYGVEAGAY